MFFLTGYVVPVNVINHFLDDVARHGRYSGVCGLGVRLQPMENEKLRIHFKMVRLCQIFILFCFYFVFIFTSFDCILYYVMICHVMLWYVMLCYDMLCYIMLWYVNFFLPLWISHLHTNLLTFYFLFLLFRPNHHHFTHSLPPHAYWNVFTFIYSILFFVFFFIFFWSTYIQTHTHTYTITHIHTHTHSLTHTHTPTILEWRRYRSSRTFYGSHCSGIRLIKKRRCRPVRRWY